MSIEFNRLDRAQRKVEEATIMALRYPTTGNKNKLKKARENRKRIMEKMVVHYR